MDKASTIGLDLAKQVFQVHGADARACSGGIESRGFTWPGCWGSLSALIRFWERERCRGPILRT